MIFLTILKNNHYNIIKMNHSENLQYSLCEKNEKTNNTTYNDLLTFINFIETNNRDDNMGLTQEIFFQTNYTRKQLDHIADYYNISKRKKKKDTLIKEIILYEQDPDNTVKVYQRKKLWTYMQEIKNDSYLKKFLIFH